MVEVFIINKKRVPIDHQFDLWILFLLYSLPLSIKKIFYNLRSDESLLRLIPYYGKISKPQSSESLGKNGLRV